MTKNIHGSVFFRRISMITLVAVYILILVGGIVRSTGSGMGCPDWPKCFGMWIPPTSESELPLDYKQKYVESRQNKNIRFARYIETLGFHEKAEIIRSDSSILAETDFNVKKTWVEYINRLLGALIGLLIIINLISSVKYRGVDNRIFLLSVALFFLVLFQGWIGSVVVSTNLMPWVITFHMLLAVLMIAILIYLVFRSHRMQWGIDDIGSKKVLNRLIIISGIFMIIQIVLGTQVREEIDVVSSALQFQFRDTWIGQLGMEFIIHRSFSILILASQLAILIILFRNKYIKSGLLNFANLLLGVMLAEVGFGAAMAYLGLPPALQPVHLLFAVLIVGFQYLMYLVINNEYNIDRKTQKVLV